MIRGAQHPQSVFRILIFCILYFVICILYFVFCISYLISMLFSTLVSTVSHHVHAAIISVRPEDVPTFFFDPKGGAKYYRLDHPYDGAKAGPKHVPRSECSLIQPNARLRMYRVPCVS